MQMFISQTLPAYLRTYVPLFVAWLVGLLATKGILVPEEVSTAFATFLGLLVAALYYALVRFLEKHKSKFGWLLLSTKKPVYLDPTLTVAQQPVEVDKALLDAARTSEDPRQYPPRY